VVATADNASGSPRSGRHFSVEPHFKRSPENFAMSKVDLKKELSQFYKPSAKHVCEVTVPPMAELSTDEGESLNNWIASRLGELTEKT
jgi:hypothetical protein